MAAKQGQRPNILVLWGDDIGHWNLSANNRGMMGYRTPNIDRIADEGINFTDYYGQQSCTAGRAAFITGQNPLRTGLTKVGMPGATLGLQSEDPAIAELHAYLFIPAHAYVGKVIESLKQYPPRQKPATFNLDQVMAQLSEGGISAH